MRRRGGGFTLIEAVVSLTISSLVVVLVSTVFLVQNRYFALQLQRSAAHENARTATDLLSAELRSVMPGAFLVADDKQLVVRSPVALAVVCDLSPGSMVTVHVEGGVDRLDTDEVAGFAMRDAVSALWSYHDIPGWATIRQPGEQPARDCAGNGADTTGIADEFQRLRRLDDYHGSLPLLGDVLMLYRTVEYRYTTSDMDTASIGLFRGVYGDTLAELVTGMDAAAGFEYRTGPGLYASPIPGPALGSIDAVRLLTQARQRAETGGQNDLTFGWGVNVYLQNVR